MMKVVISLVVIFLIWLMWACFSTGSFYKLKQLNPNIERTRSINFLLTKLYDSEENGFWYSYHVEACSLFMPNWAKAEYCVRNRIYCESKAPTKLGSIFHETHADIFSNEFRQCVENNGTINGSMEYLRSSRGFLRIGVYMALIWLTGGFNLDDKESIEYDEKNRFWLKPLYKWVQKGN